MAVLNLGLFMKVLGLCLSFPSVVTHFWTPRVEDDVYPFWTKYRSVAHVWWKINKGRGERNIFFEPCLSCFLLFWSSPFAAKSVRFLRLIRSLHINPSKFAFNKKSWFCYCCNFLFQLRLWFWLGFVRYLTILAIFCHSWHVEKLTYTFIGS